MYKLEPKLRIGRRKMDQKGFEEQITHDLKSYNEKPLLY